MTCVDDTSPRGARITSSLVDVGGGGGGGGVEGGLQKFKSTPLTLTAAGPLIGCLRQHGETH